MEAAASLFRVVLGGSLAIAYPAIAIAQPVPPVKIFPGLPPPPSQYAPSERVPRLLPQLPSNNGSNQRELEFEAPAPSAPAPTRYKPSRLFGPRSMYRVDIYGDSPLLLAQVQRIVPDAFVRQRDRTIQAGIFSDQSYAQERIRLLDGQGIRAQVTNSYAQNLNPQVRTIATYFVVIPGGVRDLPQMASQVMRLGFRRQAVRLREGPRGSHLAVGPFGNRQQAERWSSYLRTSGMDARVYFGR